MNFSECDLERIVYDFMPSQRIMYGFPSAPCKRQLRLGRYGIADLVFFTRVRTGDVISDCSNPHVKITNRGLCITVCEFKRNEINVHTFTQALKYCKGIEEYLHRRGFERFYFNIILVGNSISPNSSFVFLTDLIGDNSRDSCRDIDVDGNHCEYSYFNQRVNRVEFITYTYTHDGISFNTINNISWNK